MLKVLIVDEQAPLSSSLKLKLEPIKGWQVVDVVSPGEQAVAALLLHQPDLVVMSQKTAASVNTGLSNISENHLDKDKRLHVTARTHQGLQVVPVTDIIYFQAEHKYVMVYHHLGELLINDSLASLEQEFSHQFVRIHRNTLVAIKKIRILEKDEQGKYFLTLQGVEERLPVSRRQQPIIRKLLAK